MGRSAALGLEVDEAVGEAAEGLPWPTVFAHCLPLPAARRVQSLFDAEPSPFPTWNSTCFEQTTDSAEVGVPAGPVGRTSDHTHSHSLLS